MHYHQLETIEEIVVVFVARKYEQSSTSRTSRCARDMPKRLPREKTRAIRDF
jgi:hypothetical protein